MAAVATQLAPALPRSHFQPIIHNIAAPPTKPTDGQFTPSKHLAYNGAAEVLTMEDLGLPKDSGISPIAVSQPFKLFSEDAVHEMRREIFKPEVMENCKYSSNIAACQLRGYAPKYAPFTYDAWTHPDTLRIISSIAGVDLVPVMDFEVAHVNFSVKSEAQTKQELDTIHSKRGRPWEDDKPVVGWHRDSYPFVCVLMLSDCTNMVGGETAIKTGDGSVMKVRGPTMGCAAILQGRYITHQALRALGAQERITAVTSFRPRDPFTRDDTVLNTVRPISDLSVLYQEFAEYRLAMMEERVRAQLKEVRERRRAGKKFDTRGVKRFLAEQTRFLEHMNSEMVQDEEVKVGWIEEVDLPDCVVGEEPPAKRVRHD